MQTPHYFTNLHVEQALFSSIHPFLFYSSTSFKMLYITIMFIVVKCIVAQDEIDIFSSKQLSEDTGLSSLGNKLMQSLVLREKAIEMQEEAQKLRGQAYDLIREALVIKEEALEMREAAFNVRMEWETSIKESLALLQHQGSSTNNRLGAMNISLYNITAQLEEIEVKFSKPQECLEQVWLQAVGNASAELKEDLERKIEWLGQDLKDNVTARLEEIEINLSKPQRNLESKLQALGNASAELLENVEGKVDVLGQDLKETLETLVTAMKVHNEKTEAIKENIESNKDLIAGIQTKVEANGELTENIKSRQELMMTEVRLISLHKMSDQTSVDVHGKGGHGSALAVDGQLVSNEWSPYSHVRSFAHTSNGHNQKIWINLGALFRIYRITIWNARHGQLQRLIGVKIYADDKVVGVVAGAENIYDFKVAENDPTYAKTVTLHQERNDFVHVSEIQVWGIGPFSEDDKFA